MDEKPFSAVLSNTIETYQALSYRARRAGDLATAAQAALACEMLRELGSLALSGGAPRTSSQPVEAKPRKKKDTRQQEVPSLLTPPANGGGPRNGETQPPFDD